MYDSNLMLDVQESLYTHVGRSFRGSEYVLGLNNYRSFASGHVNKTAPPCFVCVISIELLLEGSCVIKDCRAVA